jgi:hypothetical protein
LLLRPAQPKVRFFLDISLFQAPPFQTQHLKQATKPIFPVSHFQAWPLLFHTHWIARQRVTYSSKLLLIFPGFSNAFF